MVVSLTVQDGLATVTIDNPPVNATSLAVRQGLMDALAKTEADAGICAVVLACAGRTFVAGADVSEFGKPSVAPHLPDVIHAIESASKPWIAALHGTALGGGLELAMGCHARIAAPGTRLGLPEVTLGLIPGAGGTVRLPRLVPATRALEMIATGKPVSAGIAVADGLMSSIAEGDLLEAARRLARNTVPKATLSNPLAPLDRDAFDALAGKLRLKARGQTSPLEAIAAVDRALTLPPEEALRAEREVFLALRNSDQSAVLRRIFFAERKTLRDPRTKAKPRPLDRIGVVGGGTMGAGIATASLMRGYSVQLVEQTTERADKARQTIRANLAASAKRGLIPDADACLSRLQTSDSYNALAEADLVIEAVFEDMAVKTDVVARIKAATRADTIIATNTSYLDVNTIAASLSDPSRVIGLHFFSPAQIMKLLEIVVPDPVADDVVATAAAFAKRLGKIAVLAGVCDGFIGNRIMSAYRHEADVLLLEGAMPDQIDAAMRNFGFAMGLYQMQDLAGLDIAWAMRKRRTAEHGKPADYVPVADMLCEAGRFGHKTNAGWYDYTTGRAQPSACVAKAIATVRASSGTVLRSFTEAAIMDRILARLRQEATEVLAEGIAQSPEDIDVVMVNGYGFPRWQRCVA